jgi:hypothetical protein
VKLISNRFIEEVKNMNSHSSQIIENWEETILDFYDEVKPEVQSLEEMNEDWRKCFMTDLKTVRRLDKAA